mgnify:CR=1 FL=1|tara:strand:+ start:2938 stop:4824 length:1887 start_codon:yes stop_codon:yes gene_type:complete
MASKFLATGGTQNLDDGTAVIYAASLGATNLEPSKPVKTNGVLQLVSENLDIGDVNNLAADLVYKTQLEFTEQLAGYVPQVGRQRMYFKTDEKLYKLNSNNVETEIGGGSGGGVGFAITSDVVNDGIVFRNNTDTNQIQNTNNFKLIDVLGNKVLAVPDIQMPSVFSVGESIVANTTKLTKVFYDGTTQITKIDGELDVDKIKNTNGTAEVELETDGKISIIGSNITTITGTSLAINSSVAAAPGIIGTGIVSEAGTDIRSNNGDIRLIANGGTGQTISINAPLVAVKDTNRVEISALAKKIGLVDNTAGYNEQGRVQIVGGAGTAGEMVVEGTNKLTLNAVAGNAEMSTNVGICKLSSLGTTAGDYIFLSSATECYITTANGVFVNTPGAITLSTIGADVVVQSVNNDIANKTNGIIKLEDITGGTGFSVDTQATQLNLNKTGTAWGRLFLNVSNDVILQSNASALNLQAFSDIDIFAQNADLTLSAGGNVYCPNTPIVPNCVANKAYVDSAIATAAYPYHLPIAATDEVNTITTTGQKMLIRSPTTFSMTAIGFSVNTAGGTNFSVQLRQGNSVVRTFYNLDTTTYEYATITAQTATRGDELSIFVLNAGGSTASGLKCYISGTLL